MGYAEISNRIEVGLTEFGSHKLGPLISGLWMAQLTPCPYSYLSGMRKLNLKLITFIIQIIKFLK
jgi:hypothetical protein